MEVHEGDWRQPQPQPQPELVGPGEYTSGPFAAIKARMAVVQKTFFNPTRGDDNGMGAGNDTSSLWRVGATGGLSSSREPGGCVVW